VAEKQGIDRFTCAASASCSRGMRLSLLALASTKLPSTDRSSPRTSPASRQRATIVFVSYFSVLR
jgi:hypothetical protein